MDTKDQHTVADEYRKLHRRSIVRRIAIVCAITGAALLVLVGCSKEDMVERAASLVPDVSRDSVNSEQVMNTAHETACQAGGLYVRLKPEQREASRDAMRTVSDKLSDASQYSDELKAISNAAYQLYEAQDEAQFTVAKVALNNACDS